MTENINAVEAYKTRYSLTLTKAFEESLNNSYKYAKGWYEKNSPGKYYTWNQYRAFFYNFIIGRCPELPEAMLCFLTSYFRGYDYNKVSNTETLEFLKKYVISTLDAEHEEEREIRRLEHETRKIRRILRYQDFFTAYEFVLPFLKLEEAGKLENHKTKERTRFITEMFNYGFILGKRAERARKNKYNT